jgi:hypothetical protein
MMKAACAGVPRASARGSVSHTCPPFQEVVCVCGSVRYQMQYIGMFM